MRKKQLAIIGVLTLMLSLLVPAAGVFGTTPMTGAIFTTDTSGTVNRNLYASKQDVYLNGGPPRYGAAGLPNGDYYVRVTDPSGSVILGTSVGTGNPTPVMVSNGEFAVVYNLYNIVKNNSTQGFLNTPNNGGVYKVWVSMYAHFPNDHSKTDNFRVRGNGDTVIDEIYGSIMAFKYYDANANGVYDLGELPIEGWKIIVRDGYSSLTQYTDADGFAIFELLAPGVYTVCEVLPQGGVWWVNTTPLSMTVTVTAGDEEVVSFGNVCLGAGGGRTLGFWSNRNGQRVISGLEEAQLTLANLNLVNATGGAYDPTGTDWYPGFRTWLLRANATNMSYMLSAQLAAMQLNVLAGNVVPTAIVYVPGLAGMTCAHHPMPQSDFITIGELITFANQMLGIHPLTFAGNMHRSCLEIIKDGLDMANNNQNSVQRIQCPVRY